MGAKSTQHHIIADVDAATLYLWCNGAEDDAVGCDAGIGGVLRHVGFTDGRET